MSESYGFTTPHNDDNCPECHPPWVNEGWVPCGKVRTDPERIVWMCNLPEDHEGDCSPVRAGTLPERKSQ